MLLNSTCTINRDAAVGTNGRTAKATLYTGVSCLAIPMNSNTAIQNKFEIGRGYDIYFADGQDVKPGDQIVYGGSNFMVKAVQPFNAPPVSHVRTMCQQEIA